MGGTSISCGKLNVREHMDVNHFIAELKSGPAEHGIISASYFG